VNRTLIVCAFIVVSARRCPPPRPDSTATTTSHFRVARTRWPAVLQCRFEPRAIGNQQVTVRVYPEANHLFLQAITGQPAEYATLPKVFVPALLDDIAGWIAGRQERAEPTGSLARTRPAASQYRPPAHRRSR
jgi:hypothetical protein